MFKYKADEVWVFDAEWVPDPLAGRVLYDLPVTATDREVVEVMWQRNGATEDDPMPYLKTILCRVVSIAAVIRRATPDGDVKVLLHSLPTDTESPEACDEAAILSRFLTGVGHAKPQLVGYNSQAADLKIFMQRGIVRGITAVDFCRRPEKPWEGKDYFVRGGDWHIDLKDVVSGWGRTTPSLHEIARLSGIPGKIGVDGQQVAQMWLEGDLQRIVHYNEYDALTTYLVWLRIAYFGGFFSAQQYYQEQQRVRALIAEKIQSPRYAHLMTYQEEWDRLRALQPDYVPEPQDEEASEVAYQDDEMM